MNSNQSSSCLRHDATALSSVPALEDRGEIGAPAPDNDNAMSGAVLDTTPLLAHRDLVRNVQAVLRRYGVAAQDMADAIAEVQADSIEAARARRVPADLAEWKALAVTIAVRRAIDGLRQAEVRSRYDAGLCDDADAYGRPTLHWEHRDPVDTKRYLAILKELFDSGQMPEHGAEILQGEADEVPHKEIAAEIGVSRKVVDKRLFRMRATFRARLAALGSFSKSTPGRGTKSRPSRFST
jgi:DNA-directed RNA polymerase specialized sigma24 family protein